MIELMKIKKLYYNIQEIKEVLLVQLNSIIMVGSVSFLETLEETLMEYGIHKKVMFIHTEVMNISVLLIDLGLERI